jgi:hypothetical protein
LFVLTRNYGLLSFGNEAEEDEEEITKISMVYISIPLLLLLFFYNSKFHIYRNSNKKELEKVHMI